LQNKPKKNLYKIIFLVIVLSFIISLTGCDWFSGGIWNIFDPKAQIRVDYRLDNLTAEGIAEIWFTIFSLNEVEFIGEQFLFEYYNEGIKIPELSRTIGATFYVPPSPLSSFENPVSIPKETEPGFPVYFQDVIDYMTLHPTIVELDATITVMGTDGAGHSISKTITFDLPTILPGIDFTPPTAVIATIPTDTTGIAPFTVQFDASDSTDDRGIASYHWDFGDGSSGMGITANHTYDNHGIYIVTLTVTDFFGNEGFTNITITADEPEAPTAEITTVPTTVNGFVTGVFPFKVYFDAYKSTSEIGIVSYYWEFGDGDTGTGVTTNHTYNTPGTYIVYLTVTDENGYEAYDSVIVTEPKVEATVTAVPQTIAPGGTSTITAIFAYTSGDTVPNGTYVAFAITGDTAGATLEIISGTTTNGVAIATLTMNNVGVVFVGAATSSASGSVTVTCAAAVAAE
jgi:PKD repeat protein